MTICPNCGNEVSESYDYCPRCGTKIKVSQSGLKEQIEETRHNERFSWIMLIIAVIIIAFGAIRPGSGMAIAIFILGGILLALGGGRAIWYAHRRQKLLRHLNQLER